MPRYSQGDIFLAFLNRQAELAIIFGHLGFNQLHLRWIEFSDAVPSLVRIRNPISQLSNSAYLIAPHRWLLIVPEQRNRGMSDEKLIFVLDKIFAWAKDVGVVSVITNGIANTDHGQNITTRNSDDKRAHLLAKYAAEKEQSSGMKVELISLNDVFVRNVFESNSHVE